MLNDDAVLLEKIFGSRPIPVLETAPDFVAELIAKMQIDPPSPPRSEQQAADEQWAKTMHSLFDLPVKETLQEPSSTTSLLKEARQLVENRLLHYLAYGE